MAQRMRCVDWAVTPMGSAESWPLSLLNALSICLTSRFPLSIWWGADHTLLYNDAYISFLGAGKHPRVYGRPGREVWPEVWDTIGPMLGRVMQTGQATWSEDMRMYFDRDVPAEEVHVSFSFSPIFADPGKVAGVFCACTESTEKIVSARRLQILGRLGEGAQPKHPAEVCHRTIQVLNENAADVALAAIYLMSEPAGHATLIASCGSDQRARLVTSVPLVDAPPGLPTALSRLLGPKYPLTYERLDWSGEPRNTQRAGASVESLTVFPIKATTHQTPAAGLLVIQTSAHRPFDSGYRDFLETITRQLGGQIAEASAYQGERRRAEEMSELDAAKTAFFTNVSHELRTPVSLILGPIADALADGEAPLHARHVERLELAWRNGSRLLKIIASLLDLSRLQSGHSRPNYACVDLPALTKALVSNFRSACEQAGLALIVHAPPLDREVFIDPDMWEQVVLNLLSNAFKFTLQGEIAVDLREDDSQVTLSVRDTGQGISESEVPRIFDRFHRIAGAAGRTQEGSGIGLALVREVVEAHHGTISVESTRGAGSTFHVRIPHGTQDLGRTQLLQAPRTQSSTGIASLYAQEALGWSQPWAPSEAAAAEPLERVVLELETPRTALPAHAEPVRMLVAEDNADMQAYLCSLLQPYGAVDRVTDGGQAIAALNEHDYDLLLADVVMPTVDGLELLRHVRRSSNLRFVPVVLLSARAGSDVRLQGIEAGADDYFVKPFVARDLIARIGSCLALARMRAKAVQSRDQMLNLLVAELQHRTRNLVAVMQTLARRSADESVSLGDFQSRHARRLAALSRVQGMLSEALRGSPVTFDDLLHAELAAYVEATANVTVEGVAGIVLPSRAVQVLALAIHELATNSARHGALSQTGGHLEVRWRATQDGQGADFLALEWRESELRADPDRDTVLVSSYARELVEEALPFQLGAITQFELTGNGIACSISVPLRSDG